MSCPRCGSVDLWDDNLWFGCNDCGYAGGPDGGTMIFAKDKPGLARTVKEVERHPRRTNTNYLVQAVPSHERVNNAWNEEDNE